jgi:hypothetical protein
VPLRSGVPGFLLGLAPGALLGIAAVQFADLAFFVAPGGPWRAGLLQAWSLVHSLVHENLRGSVLPFALIVLAYTWQLGKLRRLLAGGEPPGGEPPGSRPWNRYCAVSSCWICVPTCSSGWE